MLWLRGLIFTALVPGVIAFFIPRWIDPCVRRWAAGWLLILPGILIYLLCLIRFLAAGGTPAIFFTRPLGILIGAEPNSLVSSGLYSFSRNPMYLGVLLCVFGQAILFASTRLAIYGIVLCVFFHLVVVLVEEPHLRRVNPQQYAEYCKTVPRWISFYRTG